MEENLWQAYCQAIKKDEQENTAQSLIDRINAYIKWREEYLK